MSKSLKFYIATWGEAWTVLEKTEPATPEREKAKRRFDRLTYVVTNYLQFRTLGGLKK